MKTLKYAELYIIVMAIKHHNRVNLFKLRLLLMTVDMCSPKGILLCANSLIIIHFQPHFISNCHGSVQSHWPARDNIWTEHRPNPSLLIKYACQILPVKQWLSLQDGLYVLRLLLCCMYSFSLVAVIMEAINTPNTATPYSALNINTINYVGLCTTVCELYVCRFCA